MAEILDQRETRAMVRAAIDQLPENYRAALAATPRNAARAEG